MSKPPVEANLEDMIRASAANGELTYLSLCPIAGKGGIVWAAVYSPSSQFGQGFGNDPDPIAAIKLAMNDTRLRKVVNSLRKTVEKSAAKGEPEAAAVIEGLPEEVDDSDFA